MLAIAFGFLELPRAALASEVEFRRPVTLAAAAGARIFNSQLDLETGGALGLRLGLGVSEHVQVAFDYILSVAIREATNQNAGVHAMRGLLRYDLLAGDTRPYAIAGIGGLYFDFGDAPDYSTGALTLGFGVSRRLGSRTHVTLEGSTDLYQNQVVTYGPTGEELSRSPRTTEGLGTVALGVGMEF